LRLVHLFLVVIMPRESRRYFLYLGSNTISFTLVFI
jgi:hypothetical protein